MPRPEGDCPFRASSYFGARSRRGGAQPHRCRNLLPDDSLHVVATGEREDAEAALQHSLKPRPEEKLMSLTLRRAKDSPPLTGWRSNRSQSGISTSSIASFDTMPMMSHGGRPPSGEARSFEEA